MDYTGGFMNTLIDRALLETSLIDSRYTLNGISKAFYLVLSHHVGNDQTVIACTDLSLSELALIKSGGASLELMSRTAQNLFLQFIYAYSEKGIQARLRCPFLTYRLTP